jgi:hypothetical protein
MDRSPDVLKELDEWIMDSDQKLMEKYCYWSVCDGAYGAMMEHCVRSARAAGVFKEFHVLTDRPLDGCECYDAYQCDKAHGLFKLHYLKVGMSRLTFDYFVWLDADSVFVRNPADVLGILGRSPIHVPLEVNLSAMQEDRPWSDGSCFKLRELYQGAGVLNQVYLSQSAFWIVRRDAIDSVYELAFQFVNLGKEKGVTVNLDAALGYAMQLLCADPEAHLLSRHPEIWASDDLGHFDGSEPDAKPWLWRHPLADQGLKVNPAIIHMPRHKTRATGLPCCAIPGAAPLFLA